HAPSGRLYQALVKAQKAAAVRAVPFAWHDPGVLYVSVQVPAANPLEPVRDTLLEVIETLADKGVTEEEVARAKRKILTDREQAAARTTQVGIALSEYAALGDWRLYLLLRDRLEKVTAADVNRVAAAYLKRANRTVGLFIPSAKPERVAIGATPDF